MRTECYYKMANEADNRMFVIFDGHEVHRCEHAADDVEALISLIEKLSEDYEDEDVAHLRVCSVIMPGLIEMAREEHRIYAEGMRGEAAAWTAYSVFKFLSRNGAFRGKVLEPVMEKRWFGVVKPRWHVPIHCGDAKGKLEVKK